MFSILKIKLENGFFYQVRVCNFSIFEWGREKGKKFFRFPIRNKPSKNKLIFYLKVNSRLSKVTFPCLKFWLSIVKEMNGDFYLLCDDNVLERKILKGVVFDTSNIKIIHSQRIGLKRLIKKICSKRWRNAGYAHITTYLHAQRYGIKEFWNIDADDTMIFASPKDVSCALNMVADYARKNNLDAFSWDMHRSSFSSLYWTFGVTFTRLNTDIKSILKQAGDGKWRKIYFQHVLAANGQYTNLDCFFTYMFDKGQIKLGTFNIENVYFMHWGIANILEYFKTLQIVQNGRMFFPVSAAIDENKGFILCAADVISFDVGISKLESQKVLKAQLYDYFERLISLPKHFEETESKKIYQDFLKQ